MFSVTVIHHNLFTVKLQFALKHKFPYCKNEFDLNTHYDHFITCPSDKEFKGERIIKLKFIFIKIKTPPNLRTQTLLNI